MTAIVKRAYGNKSAPVIGELQFVARAAPKCNGCMFNGCAVSVCEEVTHVATRAGMPDCDDGYIYVAAPVDPRQIGIFEGGEK